MPVPDPHSPIISPGMELLFIVLPKALSLLPGSSSWTVIFFLIIVLLTLTHQVINTLFPQNLRIYFLHLGKHQLVAYI